jgi:hypothetical protein
MNFAKKPPRGLKSPKPKRKTSAGMKHMARVKLLPCVVCHQPGPSDAHHCTGGGMARDDFKVLPLCFDCHRGPEGYHAAKATWEAKNGKDYEFLPVVADMLAGDITFPWG